VSAKRYAMAVDTRTCVGCAACVIACKTENNVARGHARDWIVSETEGSFPDLRMTIRSERCNHCEDAPCVTACPTGASYYGPGGIVLIDYGRPMVRERTVWGGALVPYEELSFAHRLEALEEVVVGYSSPLGLDAVRLLLSEQCMYPSVRRSDVPVR